MVNANWLSRTVASSAGDQRFAELHLKGGAAAAGRTGATVWHCVTLAVDGMSVNDRKF